MITESMIEDDCDHEIVSICKAISNTVEDGNCKKTDIIRIDWCKILA